MKDEKRAKIIKKIYGAGIKKSKNIEDKGQKYDILSDDLHSIITNINSNFDFKTFNKDTLKEVEIVSLYQINNYFSSYL